MKLGKMKSKDEYEDTTCQYILSVCFCYLSIFRANYSSIRSPISDLFSYHPLLNNDNSLFVTDGAMSISSLLHYISFTE